MDGCGDCDSGDDVSRLMPLNPKPLTCRVVRAAAANAVLEQSARGGYKVESHVTRHTSHVTRHTPPTNRYITTSIAAMAGADSGAMLSSLAITSGDKPCVSSNPPTPHLRNKTSNPFYFTSSTAFSIAAVSDVCGRDIAARAFTS